MIKMLITIIVLLNGILFADPSSFLYGLYQNGRYAEGCDYGIKHFPENRQKENFVSLTGFSCLQADQIEKLGPIASALTNTPEARSNGSYFTLLLMQKKLLMQAVYDEKPLLNLKFPTSSHVISKLFSLYLKDPQKGQSIKEYQDPTNPRQSFRLYPSELNGQKGIAIDEYYDKILTTHHYY